MGPANMHTLAPSALPTDLPGLHHSLSPSQRTRAPWALGHACCRCAGCERPVCRRTPGGGKSEQGRGIT